MIDGDADIGGVHCGRHDYQQRSAGGECQIGLGSTHGARLMLREARPARQAPGIAAAVQTSRAGMMGWELLAEGISRCLLAPPQAAAASTARSGRSLPDPHGTRRVSASPPPRPR